MPHEKSALPYVVPFLAFICFLVVDRSFGLSPSISYAVRCLVVATALAWSYRELRFALLPCSWLGSIAMGVLVFVIWIGPDLLWPGYRNHWLFSNSLTGSPVSSISPQVRSNTAFLALRTIGCVLLVPVLEELFWRGWMMRWLINKDFFTVPLGAYAASSFWMVALLFASEHGPYWEVGLLAGIAYNWWMVRTRSLADCILAHAVTNGCLSAYVLATGNWQYWL